MSVKIRLTRMGKKKQPSYRVVVMDSRKPRDGKYIEQIGRYEPRAEPSVVEIDNDKALMWLQRGAQPTERARKLLEISGAWTRFRVAKGDIHTVGITQTAEEPPPPAPEPEAAAEPALDPAAETGTEAVADEAPAVEPEAAAEPAVEAEAVAPADEPAADVQAADTPAADTPAADSEPAADEAGDEPVAEEEQA